MAELEIHHEGHESDPLGKKIGILAAIISVFLGVVTIASHRAHTEGVLLKTDANDKWSYYQAQRMKFHNLELGEDLLNAIPNPTAAAQKTIARYASDKGKYDSRSKQVQEDAKKIEERSELVEQKALKFDFGEGLLEIGLVMTSLFFISKNTIFPILGVLLAIGGCVMGTLGFLL
jgi:hypothetical protein